MEEKCAIGYARVSTAKQVEAGLSLGAQEERIRQWCTMNDYQLVGLYTDAGLSGRKFDNRPSMQSALNACKKATALVTYSLSRLTRSTKDLIHIAEQLHRQGADLVSVSENLDTTSATGKMMFRMLGVMAEFERDIIGERTSLAMQAKKAKGEYIGGFIPYGYQLADDGKTLIEIPAEQKIIQLAKQSREQGHTLEQIADQLYQQGCGTRKNKKFLPYQVSRILGEARN